MNDSRTLKYYRDRAPEYEQIYYRPEPERRREIDDEANRLKGYVRDCSVLEWACGTGYWTRIMAETASHIIAFDFWMEMIAQARKKKYRSPVAFLQADMEYLPLKAAVFDFLAVGFWFSHQPCQEYERFFERLKYPLKKDGRIWMIDNNPPAEGLQKTSPGCDKFGNNLKERFLDNGREYIIIKNYFEEMQLRDIFTPAFKIERLVFGKYYWSILMTSG